MPAIDRHSLQNPLKAISQHEGLLDIPGCFCRGLGKFVTQVCGHIRTLQGWREPSRKSCFVSDKWMPPSGVLGRVFAGTRARQ